MDSLDKEPSSTASPFSWTTRLEPFGNLIHQEDKHLINGANYRSARPLLTYGS